MFIPRALTESLKSASRSFYVILLTGPRQTGKTALLQNLREKERSYISLDDISSRLAAQQDPAGFIERLKLPVLIDEAQYAPQLFPYIKMTVDKMKIPGLFWLTGSQRFSLMKGVSESLAGRVAIFKLQGLSLSEEEGRASAPPFFPVMSLLKERQKTVKPLSLKRLFARIWRGSYPHLAARPESDWSVFYESYTTTYIERDVRSYLNSARLLDFQKFFRVLAARTGQRLNYRDISKDTGVSEPTVKSWFEVLQATGLVVLVQPYFNNRAKRLLKTPKLYFMDTGLCCFLTGWLTPETLEKGAVSGPMLETYVVSEIIKSHIHNGRSPQIFYCADKEGREIDLLLEKEGRLHPLEIKKTLVPGNIKLKPMSRILKNLKAPAGSGGILYPGSAWLPLQPGMDAVPICFI